MDRCASSPSRRGVSMSCRNKYIAVVALGMASHILGSWLLGKHTPNAWVLLLGALLLALLTTQAMLVAILVISTRREGASDADPPR
jgi:hypothetical protein